jgi:hypothetical protein
MKFTFLSTTWNCLFIAIMVILIIAIIAKKIKNNNWTWADVYKTIKDKLSESVVLYIFRWILVLSMGVLGYLMVKEWFTLIPYAIWVIGAWLGVCEECFTFASKICILLQMIVVGIMVLIVVGWKLALIFIPLALIGWVLVPENYDDMPW